MPEVSINGYKVIKDGIEDYDVVEREKALQVEQSKKMKKEHRLCNQTNTYSSKLNATMASGYETQLYILDEKTLEQLNEIAENYGGFLIESTDMPAAVTELQDDQGYKFPEGMIIGRRVLKGTVMENNETAVAASDNAVKVLENIRNAVNP